jgi:hypothetical protein
VCSSSSSGSDSEEPEAAPPELPLAGPRHGNAADDVIEITDSSDDEDREPLFPARVGVGVVRLPPLSTPRRRHDGFDTDGLLVL